MDYAVKLSSVVTGFSVDEKFMDCICADKVMKIEKSTGNTMIELKLFKKEGFSRNLMSMDHETMIRDFYTLYILDKEDYSIKASLQLGTDLSSDICGMTADEINIYASIRNGSLIVVDRKTFEHKIYLISDNSVWDIKIKDGSLIGGTVDGKLLVLDLKEMKIKSVVDIGKQNIGSISLDDHFAYTAGQDKKLSKINLLNLECTKQKRNAHKRMFDCIGVYKNCVLTVSYPCSEISFWDKETFELVRTINVPLSLAGRTYIEDNTLYISSRNIQGIGMIGLD